MLYGGGNPVAAPSTSRGRIAKMAVGLALFGGATNLAGGVLLLVGCIADPGRFDDALAIFTTLGALLMGFGLIYGGILILRRDEIGRYWVVAVTGVAILTAVAGLARSIFGYELGLGVFWWSNDYLPLAAGRFLGFVGQMTAFLHSDRWGSAIDLALPLVTLLLTLSRYTVHWTRSAQPAHPVP